MTVWQGQGDSIIAVNDLTDPTLVAKMRFASRAGGGVDLVDGNVASFDSLYRSQPWLRAVIDKLARGIGRLPAKVYADDTAETGKVRIRRGETRGGDLVFSPYPGGTTMGFWSRIVHEVAKRGKCWALLLPEGGGIPNAVVPVPRTNVRPVWSTPTADGVRTIIAYDVTAGGERRRVSPDLLVPFQFETDVSPIEALARTLAMEDAGQRAALSSFRNGVRPSGIVSLDPGVLGARDGKMSKTQLDYLKGEFQSEHGGIDNRFKLAAINAAIRWTPISHTAQEAEVIAHRKLNREEVCAVYDVPPPILHILDRATFSNIDEQHRMLYMDTLGPWLVMLEQTWNALVFGHPLYGAAFGRVFLEFDLDGVLRGDLKTRAESYQKLLQVGYTVNEIRRMENLPRIEHPLADVAWVPLNLRPVGEGAGDDIGDLSLAAQRFGLAIDKKVIDRVEARELLNRVGAGLDASKAAPTPSPEQLAALAAVAASE